MCCPKPSATSITPISSKNASARIFTVGCRSTKSPIFPANTSITATLRIMAVIITHRSLAIPTAVITESSEKTTSRTRICASTAETAGAPGPFEPSPASGPSSFACISCADLPTRNRPPAIRIRSRPDLVSKHREERSGQPHQPGKREQQADADHQRQRDADPADALALVRRDPPDQDRDEHHVVDAQHDLHRGEREQGNPGIRIGRGVHGGV